MIGSWTIAAPERPHCHGNHLGSVLLLSLLDPGLLEGNSLLLLLLLSGRRFR